MAERNEEVLAQVRDELAKRPNLSSGVLFQMAQRIDPSLSEKSEQWFYTRYVVPVRHEQTRTLRKRDRSRTPKKTRQRRVPQPAPAPSPPAEATFQPEPAQALRANPPPPPRAERQRRQRHKPVDRNRVRGILMQFARELTEAQSRAEIVRVLGRLDHYVDQVLPPSP